MTASDTGPTFLRYLDLTTGQRRVLDELPFDGNHLVCGPPGSGKSVLAVQRAAMTALTGTPTTLVCRSNLLRQYVEPAAAALSPGLSVATVHSWLGTWYALAVGGRPPTLTPGGFDIDWTALLTEVAGTDGLPTAGALVVDEGQDLPVGFYRLCRLAGAQVTVFADEYQTITETRSTAAEIRSTLTAGETRMAGNHRTSRPIAELAERFRLGGPEPLLPDRDGPVPVLARYRAFGELTTELRDRVRQHPEHTIGVVVRFTEFQLRLLEALERSKVPVQAYTGGGRGRYRDIDVGRPGVHLVTRASMKGLEFDTVIVPDCHHDTADVADPDQRMTYYVLATRARHELLLGFAGERPPAHLADLPRHLFQTRP
ncbi:ATP-binding domain-containing protein [Nocardiopsis sp. RV163]|uniref:ATP-binding domain-containing protein n=1 Tax=Nocardiopsis sp. RV163 TaxID=1661388 RepID=UPI00064C1A13|nr:ATP-binding domain-containing protein [Nocardiopsis sp. RV163]